MLSRRVYLGLTKVHPLSWSVCRRVSEQTAVVEKKPVTPLQVASKPSRPPFMKNVFLGVYDLEMLVYPELDKTSLQELKVKIEPYEEFFKNCVDPQTLSMLKIIPNEMRENFKNLGLFGQIVPSVYGGCEQTATQTALISEIIAKDLNVALMLYSHNFLAVQSLVMFGSQQQKEKYLPRLASGEWVAAFCMSESVSSSDLASILTKIDPSDDKSNPDMFVLNGKKLWVLNGNNSNLFVVLAKMDFRTHVGQIVSVVRMLLVEKDSPGVTVSKPQEHLGLEASNICEVNFKDTPVHRDNLIGSETQGYEFCARVLNSGRYNLGAITVSFLKDLFNKATDFIISRQQSDKPLIECEHIQGKVADISRCIYTLESMTYLTTGILDKYDQDCTLELAIIKVFCFTEGRQCLDMIMELMGGRAFLSSEVTQKHFRDFRTMEVFDGTTDIAKLFIVLFGLQHAGVKMNDTVSKIRFPYQYPGFIFKRLITNRKQMSDNPVLNLRLYEQLHPSLKLSANELEYCVLRLHFAVDVLFHRYGTDVVNQQIELMRLADAAVKIYGMTAVLGRASRSYCIGLPNAETELRYAIKTCFLYKRIIQSELNDVIDGLIVSGDALTLKFGTEIFKNNGYYVQHPLERSY